MSKSIANTFSRLLHPNQSPPIMALPVTPTNPKSSVEVIKEFLRSLHEFPQGPNVTSVPLSFPNKFQKAGWVKHFKEQEEAEDEDEDVEDRDYIQYLTFSEAFAEGSKEDTMNRIGLLNRPVGNWVGKTKAETDWPVAPWHAMGIAWIKTPDTEYGRDLIVYDVENLHPDDPEVKRWTITSMPIIRGYVEFCRDSKPKKNQPGMVLARKYLQRSRRVSKTQS